MKARGLMIVGISAALVASIAEIAGNQAISVSMLAFAGGALFGKGYGIWEERSRKPKPQMPPNAWFYYKEDGE